MIHAILIAFGTVVTKVPTKNTAGYAGAGGLGVVLGVFGGVDDPMLLIKWITAQMGVVGFVIAFFTIGMGFGWYATALYFISQKAEDESRWNERFLQLRNDTKKAFEMNAASMDRVTTMLENAAGMRTPSSG